MEESQEDKQNFLRENILEKGYDVNQFVSFLTSKKGEAGSDISNWSMNDLYEVVQEFIKNNSPQDESQSQQNQTQTQTQAQTKNNNDNILNKSLTANPSNPIKLTDEDYGLIIPEYVNCIKSETTELSKYDNIEITVKEPQKVDNGFFSKAFINFLITTNPINANVRRKHSDFVWLKERLAIIFNLNVLPRLPKKGKVNEDKHINKRMRSLERFLVYLAKDPLIKNSQILFDFLTIENDSDFEKRKKIYNKMKTPIELKDIKTVDGKMKVKITPQKEKFLENIKNNASFNETALKKFNQNFKILKTEMNTAISRILSFNPLFDKLIKISSTYLDNNIIIESYNQMKNIFNSWADTLKKQNAFFLNDVKEYLKLLSGNYHHIRDIVQVVEAQKNNYNKLSKNLISKKIELFRKGDVSNWQLDIKDKNNLKEFYADRLASYKKICFKDTNNVIKIKEKYGYHLNKIISEYQRLRNINTVENKEKVVQFSKKESQICTEYLKIMGDIEKIMDECVEKENKDKGEKLQPSMSINYEEENDTQKKEDNGENQNQINTDNYEKQKEEIQNEIKEEKIEYHKEEVKNEINDEKEQEKEINKENIKDKKEERIEEKKEENNYDKKEENDEEKKEENDVEKKEENDVEKKEEKTEDKKEENVENEERDNNEKLNQEKNEDNLEEKKDDDIEEKKNENVEEKNENNIEDKNEENNEDKKEGNMEENPDANKEE